MSKISYKIFKSNLKNRKSRANLTLRGEIRIIEGKKTLILPCVEPKFIPKKSIKFKKIITKFHKNK